MLNGGPLGNALFAVLVLGSLALLMMIIRDEVWEAASRRRRIAAGLAVLTLLGSLWLLLSPLRIQDGALTCTFWPATDMFGPDGSAAAVGSVPEGPARRATEDCISSAKVRVGGALGLFFVAGVGYAIARPRD